MPDEGKKSTIEQLGDDFSKQFKFDASTFLQEFDKVSKAANDVNSVFTQGRQRINELRTSLTDAAPDVLRLGGELSDVSSIIGKVAEESRRNVVASTESVEKLFAAQKVLGLGADTLTKAFLDVGRGIETIPETLEESVQYIQSIGGNAKSVMQDVTRNMDQMNRFQFEGGVLGLTKMVAQASMLRFDMNQTFQLADKVLSPEGAIETAAAFQRLGASVGVLADPFALMNSSINDPGALQDSLVDVAKQFTYFDEKTKTFKINPQGVLTLKEIQNQTGVSAAEMSKLGLAAAEADKRISAIGEAGLNIAEDDKQYLANIATMGKGGEYEVKLRDESGKEQTKKLTQVTQDEFEKLIDEQKKGPKTLEDIARSQMSTTDVIMGDVRAIRAKFVGGVISAGQTQEAAEGLRRGLTTISGGVADSFQTKDVRRETQIAQGDLGTFFDELKDDKIDKTTALKNYLEKAGAQLGNIEGKFTKTMNDTAEKIRENLGDKTIIERAMKDGFDFIKKEVGDKATPKQTTNTQPYSSFIEGRQAQMTQSANTPTTPIQTTSKVDVGGKIQVEFTSTNGTELSKKMLDDWANSDTTKQYFIKLSQPYNINRGPVSTTYGT